MRVDAGLARLLGLSRTAAAASPRTAESTSTESAVGKSDRLVAGAWLEVRLPEAPAPLDNPPVDIEGMDILYADDDIVAVDKPAGVAAHASVGLDRPDGARRAGRSGLPDHHVGRARAQGHRAASRRRDVGRDGGGDLRARLHRAQACVQGSAPSTSATTHWFRGIPIRPAAPSTRPSGGTEATTGSSPSREGGRHSITHYDTVEAFAAASLLDVHLETGRTHQIRVHFSALHHPCCGDLTYGADPTLAKRLGLERQWLHARYLAFAHPADGRRVEITSPYPADLQHALDVLAPPRIVTERVGAESRVAPACCSASAPSSGGGCAPASSPCCCPPARWRCWRTASCGARCACSWCSSWRAGSAICAGSAARTWLLLVAASVLISINWGIYIYAATHGHVVDAALGYFINPLVTVALGVLVFRERIGRWQLIALALAVVAVVVLTAGGRRAALRRRRARRDASRSTGVVKKVVVADPRVSVAVETFLALPLAGGYLITLQVLGQGHFVELRVVAHRPAVAGRSGDRSPAAAVRRRQRSACRWSRWGCCSI